MPVAITAICLSKQGVSNLGYLRTQVSFYKHSCCKYLIISLLSQVSSLGVQHIDCDQEDELYELFLCEVDDVNNDEYNDIPRMENGEASLPNLSTNEEEPSILHDDSPLRQT